jgi:energy-coupling factor transport system ATP-binding protein
LTQRRGRTYRFSRVSDAVAHLRPDLHSPPNARSARPAALEHRERSVLPEQRAESEARASHPSASTTIDVDHVSFTYDDGAVALKDVSLALPAGQFLVLAGPNGSGKTTLAKHFNGLLKPSSGRVAVAGQDTRPLRVAQLARRVGYVFQNPDHQIFAPTVREEIAFGLRLQGLTEAEVEERVSAALAAADLTDAIELPPATLSLGRRRLVTLAAVLATQPAILVLDEPTGGLDWRSRQDFMDRVTAFNRAGGAVVLITHDVRLIAERAERVVVLRAGRVLFDGAPTALFANRPVLVAARLTAPPVVRLAQRLAARGEAVRAGVVHDLATVRSVAELVDVL